jgi:SAM-dependent methyltransferase
MTEQTADPRDFWERFYRKRDQVWSGRPNVVLVDEVTGLDPGTALDLGCGEGADAIWLAARGWRVTAADISQEALDRGARHAEDAGVADRITWARHDFARSVPNGPFDLVSAHFLHSPVDDSRDGALRRALAAVAPGGTLLVVSHEQVPWADHDVRFPSAEDVLASLAVDDDEWAVEQVGSSPRMTRGPDGEEAEILDSVVRLRRR